MQKCKVVRLKFFRVLVRDGPQSAELWWRMALGVGQVVTAGLRHGHGTIFSVFRQSTVDL